MAVPFNIPEDQNEVEVIIRQLQSLLTRLQVAVRRTHHGNSHNSQPATSTSVATRFRNSSSGPSSSSMHRTSRDAVVAAAEPHAVPNHNLSSSSFPDLFNDSMMVWLAAVSQDVTATTASQLTSIPVERSPRRRTSSESSCCEETKISITAIVNNRSSQDWTQVGVTLGKIADDFHLSARKNNTGPRVLPQAKSSCSSGDGLLSKLVPQSMTGPLWTAMICFVGWHLFRAR